MTDKPTSPNPTPSTTNTKGSNIPTPSSVPQMPKVKPPKTSETKE